jgi:hypothetical protein
MDALLQTLGVQTFNFAVRSGIALTSRYAVQQCSRLLKSINDKAVRSEFKALQKLLDNKIKVRLLSRSYLFPRGISSMSAKPVPDNLDPLSRSRPHRVQVCLTQNESVNRQQD